MDAAESQADAEIEAGGLSFPRIPAAHCPSLGTSALRIHCGLQPRVERGTQGVGERGDGGAAVGV